MTKHDASRLALARSIAEQEGLPGAVAKTGIGYAALYYHARTRAWDVARKDGRGRKRNPDSHRLDPIYRQCPTCLGRTLTRPCGACGAA